MTRLSLEIQRTNWWICLCLTKICPFSMSKSFITAKTESKPLNRKSSNHLIKSPLFSSYFVIFFGWKRRKNQNAPWLRANIYWKLASNVQKLKVETNLRDKGEIRHRHPSRLLSTNKNTSCERQCGDTWYALSVFRYMCPCLLLTLKKLELLMENLSVHRL